MIMFLGINTWCVDWLRKAGGDVYHRDNAGSGWQQPEENIQGQK